MMDHLRFLRASRWWKWVGLVWGALAILWPTAAYALRISGR